MDSDSYKKLIAFKQVQENAFSDDLGLQPSMQSVPGMFTCEESHDFENEMSVR